MDLDHEKRLTAVEDRAQSNTEQLEEVKKRLDNQDELISSVAVLAKEQEHIQKDVGEIKADVKALTDKPAKRWEGLVDKILLVLAGAFVAWLATGAPGVGS